MWTEQLIAFLW